MKIVISESDPIYDEVVAILAKRGKLGRDKIQNGAHPPVPPAPSLAPGARRRNPGAIRRVLDCIEAKRTAGKTFTIGEVARETGDNPSTVSVQVSHIKRAGRVAYVEGHFLDRRYKHV